MGVSTRPTGVVVPAGPTRSISAFFTSKSSVKKAVSHPAQLNELTLSSSLIPNSSSAFQPIHSIQNLLHRQASLKTAAVLLDISRLQRYVHLFSPFIWNRVAFFQSSCRSLCWWWQMVPSMDQIDLLRTKTRHGVLRGFRQWEFRGLYRHLLVSRVGSIVTVAGNSHSSDGRDDGVWRIDNFLETGRIELHLDQNRRSLQRLRRRTNQVGLHGRRRLGYWVTIVNSRRNEANNCGRDTSRVREFLAQRDAFSICSSSSSICKSKTWFGNFGFACSHSHPSWQW